MKITKPQQKAHDLAVELLHSYEPGVHNRTTVPCPKCDDQEGGCEFFGCFGHGVSVSEIIYQTWLPGCEHSIGKGGIFFTPIQHAASLWQANGLAGRMLEPTAGIGVIAYSALESINFATQRDRERFSLTCIEQQPKFVEVGKRLLPECDWICGDLFDVLPKLGSFRTAIGNPPFGQSASVKGIAHYAVCDLLTRHTEYGATLILPTNAHDQQNVQGGKPSLAYQAWQKRNPGWAITPTSWDGPSEFQGAKCTTHVCHLERIERYVPDESFEPEPEPAEIEQPQPIVSLRKTKPLFVNHPRPVKLEQTELI